MVVLRSQFCLRIYRRAPKLGPLPHRFFYRRRFVLCLERFRFILHRPRDHRPLLHHRSRHSTVLLLVLHPHGGGRRSIIDFPARPTSTRLCTIYSLFRPAPAGPAGRVLLCKFCAAVANMVKALAPQGRLWREGQDRLLRAPIDFIVAMPPSKPLPMLFVYCRATPEQ